MISVSQSHVPVSLPTRLEATATSICGARNAENQDACLLLTEHGVFAICDGMGGHAGGQVASQLIVRSLSDMLHNIATHRISVETLIDLIEFANRAVYQHAEQHLSLRGMGSTLVLAWIANQQVQVFHVGDSRAYRLRDFRLHCLTQDHSGRDGKGVNRALGVKKTVSVEHHAWDWRPKDRLLLVSDGISNALPDFQLTNLLVETRGPMVIKTAQLTAAATAAGGTDDKTAVLIQNYTGNVSRHLM